MIIHEVFFLRTKAKAGGDSNVEDGGWNSGGVKLRELVLYNIFTIITFYMDIKVF